MRTEISIAIEIMNTKLFRVWHTIAIAIAVIFQPNGTLAIVATEKVTLLTFVASCNEFFQSESFKVVTKIVKEIAYTRVVTITQHCFTSKVLLIVFQFVFNIWKLSIKLVVFILLCLLQCSISHNVID